MIVLNPNTVGIPLVATVGGVLLAIVLFRFNSPKPSTPNSRKIHTLKTKKPLIGDLLEVVKNEDVRHHWFASLCGHFDYEPFLLSIPFTPEMVVLSNEKDVEAVMTTQFHQFVKGPMHNDILQDLLGNGILTTDGEQWYHQRKTAAKFFTSKTLRLTMMNWMQRNLTKVYDFLDSKCDKNEYVNLSLLFHQFTFQTFVEVGVGMEFPVIGNEKPLAFEDAMDAVSPLLSRRALLPTFVWKMERWLQIGKEKELAKLIQLTRENAHKLISAGLARLSQEKETKNETVNAEKVRSAIDLFVEHSDPDKMGLRPEDLIDFMLTFVMAARDTSSLTLMWLFYWLHTYPEVEAKIRAELMAKLPSLGVGRDDYITTDHIKHLVYLEATIKETLRLYPAAPLNMRQAAEDTFINGDLFIKKGQVLTIPIYAMARNVNVWGPDANEFKPERWINSATGELIPLPAGRYFSFSTGPRTCIGMKLAMLNLRIVTANLLHRYKFVLDSHNDGNYINALILMMKEDVLAKVQRI